MMRQIWVAGLMSVTMGVARQTASVPSQPLTEKPHAVLVELFTSEGCSSCPPADSVLRRIDGTVTDKGTLIVGISEHVTYWDHDGWKDPYDSDDITERQNEYGRKFNLPSVFTPQMVVEGETQFVGSDTKALMQALDKAGAETGATVQIGALKVNGDTVEATVSIAGKIPSHGVDVFAAVAEDETTEHVLRGENKGRTLEHASVARAFVKTGKMKAAGEIKVRVKLPSEGGTKRHLIVSAQEPGLGRVAGVDSQTF